MNSELLKAFENRSVAILGAGTTATATGLMATLGLAAVSWVVAIRQMNGMDMGVGTRLGSFGVFIALWVLMMAAMILPGPPKLMCSKEGD